MILFSYNYICMFTFFFNYRYKSNSITTPPWWDCFIFYKQYLKDSNTWLAPEFVSVELRFSSYALVYAISTRFYWNFYKRFLKFMNWFAEDHYKLLEHHRGFQMTSRNVLGFYIEQ